MRKKQTSILSYWTFRYFIILCTSLAIIALCAVYWIMDTAKSSRLNTAALLGQEIAERVVTENGELRIPPKFDRLLDSRTSFFEINSKDMCLLVLDDQGNLLFSRPKLTDSEVKKKLTDDLGDSRDRRFMAITTPIENGGELKGQVTLLQSKRSLMYSPNEMILVTVLLLTLILCGWFTVYLLSRKLSRPIRKVAVSARHIANGNYDVDLNVETHEQEMTELVASFRDMTLKLKQLEEWRALSLAGVTHELKTPVTSIKGLLLAIREGVVTHEEANEFLDIALQESVRLERMVADLLHYNAFSSGSLEVRKDAVELSALVSEIAYQWQLAQNEVPVEVVVEPSAADGIIGGDALRIQQIVVNLLNNAKQAAVPERKLRIEIRLRAGEDHIAVEVSDNGSGITEEEQPHIFERFFRGMRKKRQTRGLGLGLTYSRLLAQAQCGQLWLGSSSPAGSTFILELRRLRPLPQESENDAKQMVNSRAVLDSGLQSQGR